MKFKIYLTVIALLFAFLVYAVFFMKSDYETGDKLAPTVHTRTVDPVNHRIVEYIPDYLPQPIPESVLKFSKKYDFFYYMFINENKKSVVYNYKEGSTASADSESFHKEIDTYLKKVRFDGNYKNQYTTSDGTTAYIKKLFENNKAVHYVPQKGDSKFLIKKMENEKSEIKEVEDFYRECAKTFCIINNKTDEYVILDKRDIGKAKKLLDDYKLW